MDVDILARNIVKELLDREREVQASAKGQGLSPWGGMKYLTSEGLAALPVAGSQSQLVLQRTSAEPRAWIITMAGKIQQGSAVAPPIQAYPFARFLVQWGSSAATYQTEVDGFSDQFLALWGNQVTVSCEWSFDDFTRMHVGQPTVTFPVRMIMKASIAPSDGAVTKAWRTFVVPPGVTTTLPVPYGAIGVIVRGFFLGPMGISLLFASENGGVATEFYTTADVQAAHDSGGYLSVPSMTDIVLVTVPPGGPGVAYVEFLVEP